jgi:hypothetical protein
VNEPLPTVLASPFSEGIDPMTDNEQVIAEAIARAFETLSERLSRELEDAFNQMAQLIGRAQKQQYEIMSLFGKQAAAMEALADLVAKVRNDDVERHNDHAAAIEQLSKGQMKIAQFTASTPWRRRRSVRITTSRHRRRLSTEGREPLEWWREWTGNAGLIRAI